MNQELIKLIAVLCMVPNHIANAMLMRGTAAFEVMSAIGCFTSVTMCWFLVEGYHKTSNVKAYLKRLIIGGAVSQIPFMMCFYDPVSGIAGIRLNMMFSLALGLCLLIVIETWTDLRKKQIAVIAVILVSTFCDWAYVVPIYLILFRRAHAEPSYARKAWNEAAMVCAIYSSLQNIIYMPIAPALAAAILSAIVQLIAGLMVRKFYHGQRKTANLVFSKWFFYGFYPVHLLMIGVAKMMIR